MTFSDYLLDTVLILLVVRQVREARFDRFAVLLPLGITAIVAHSYLHSIPTGGNNLILIAALTAVGVAFGTISALNTRVRSDGGRYPLVKANATAAGVWVFSMGSRMAFAIWASNAGGPSLYRFSVQHHLDRDVWTAALVLMALGEVVTRTALLAYRGHRVQQVQPQPQLVTV
ncbi:hypothetical protein [Jatrophihabitans sp.]|uniref:hypothetical protein n=1 Tax=Jatrophihabitans sp. TaxID=1932789 RepID=UPI0030C73DAE|nr:rane protein [Jatrophihabitans sp.]